MCIVTVTDITGIGPDPTKIRVFGTAEDCGTIPEDRHVLVDVACGDGAAPFIEGLKADIIDGEWDIVIDVLPEHECKCGGIVTATARCSIDDSCTGSLTVDQLRCPECPKVNARTNEPGEFECNPDGTVSVPLEAQIINNTPTDIIAFIECGPGGVLDPLSSPSSVGVPSTFTRTVTAICRYPTPASPEPFVRLTDFAGNAIGCPDTPFASSELDCNCPKVIDLLVEVEGCFAQFSGTLAPAVTGCEFKWDFGDGDEVTTTVPMTEHTYNSVNPANPGGWPVAVVVICPNCDSPEVTPIIAPITECTSLGACCLPDGTCDVMTEAECAAQDGIYKGDGSGCEECIEDIACGKPTVAFAVAQAVLLSGLVILNLLKYCLQIPIPTELYLLLTGLALAPLIIYGVYELLCAADIIEPECCFNKCDRYFMAWIPLVSAAIVALYLKPCCGTWWWAVVAGLFAVGMTMFYLWYDQCHPNRCEILKAWGLVIISGVPAAFLVIKSLTDLTSWLSPIMQQKLADCPSSAVGWLVAIAGITIYILIYGCEIQDEAPSTGGAQLP